MGNNVITKVTRIGSISIKMANGADRVLTKVRHVPYLKRSLISLGTLEKSGYIFKGENSALKVSKGSMVVMKGGRRGNCLYVLKGETVVNVSSVAEDKEPTKTMLWYQRLGHMNEKGLKELENQNFLGKDNLEDLQFCEHCIFGKQTRVSFKISILKIKIKMDYVHSDLWEPSRNPTHGGNKCFMSFIDDFSRKVWIYLLKSKNEAFKIFVEWRTMVENHCDRKIKTLKNDNGLEFC